MKKPYDERESENKSGSFMSKFFSKFRKSDKQEAETVAADAQTVDSTQSVAPSFEPDPIQQSPVQSAPVQNDTTPITEETAVETAIQAEESVNEEASVEVTDTPQSENVEDQQAVKEDNTVSAEPEKTEKKAKAPSKPRAKKAAPAVETVAEQKEEAPKPKQKFKVEKTGAYYQSDDSFMRFGGKSDLNSELFSTSFDIGDNKKQNK